MTVSPVPQADKENVQSSQTTYGVIVKATSYGTSAAVGILIIMALTLL